jgi:type II secretory pathway predicted ATPase ExeA
MGAPGLHTPFENSCDPAAYIPRRASETALLGLCSLVRIREPAIVLHGPSGIGKSLLLHVLHERLKDERRVIYASVSNAPAPELCHRVLGLLGEPDADDPAEALVAAAHRSAEAGQRILLLVDHANLAPIASSIQLLRASEAAMPQLSVVFAVADEDGASEFARALGAEGHVSEVAFDRPMSAQEATSYLRLKLAAMDLSPDVRARLDGQTLSEMATRSHGLPRALNALASDVLTQFGYQPPDLVDPLQPAHDAQHDEPSGPAWSEPPPQGSLSGSLLHGDSAGAGATPGLTRPDVSLGGGLLGPSPNPKPLAPWRPSFESPESGGSGRDIPPAPPEGPDTAGSERVEARDTIQPEPARSEPAGERAESETRRPDAAAPSPETGEAPTRTPADALDAEADVLEEHAIEAPHVPATVIAIGELTDVGRGLSAPLHDPADEDALRHTPPEPASHNKLALVGVAAAAILGGVLFARTQLTATDPEPAPRETTSSAAKESTPPAQTRVVGTPARLVEPARAPEPKTARAPAPSTVFSTTLTERKAALPVPVPVVAQAPAPDPRPAPKPTPAATPDPVAAKTRAPAERPSVKPTPVIDKAPTTTLAAVATTPAAKTAPPAITQPSPRAAAPERRTTAASSRPDRQPATPVTRDAVAPASGPIVVTTPGARPMGSQPTAYVRLRVDVEPGATLRIDGQKIGVAPLADLLIEPGPHVFAAETPDGLLIEQLIEVGAQTGVVFF